MQTANTPVRASLWSDLRILLLLAAARLLLALLFNGNYGFHRDELDILDNARYPAWGYVAYPPVAPMVARVGLELFGGSLLWLRMIPALVQAVAMILVGLMAREMGGGRWAQVVAVVAAATAPAALIAGLLLQYMSFDYFWWVLVAATMTRRLGSGDRRWWLAVGAAIGLGMMTKYTIAFFVVGVVAAVLLTPLRRDLRSPWLWAGAGLAFLIFLPNLIWQVGHGFVSLEFLQSIHARDIRWGRTDTFLLDQLYVTAVPLVMPIWAAGLIWLGFSQAGRRFRPLAWMFVVTFLLIWVQRGRGYYTGGAYPMLLAAGAVAVEQWLAAARPITRRWVQGAIAGVLALSVVISPLLSLPVAPVNSPLWDVVVEVNETFVEMIGWPEMVAEVVRIYQSLSPEEQAQAGILAMNYGNKGAIALYGPAYGLPTPISPGNSSYFRGYGDPPPQTVILVGMPPEAVNQVFSDCAVAGSNVNPYGVANEESTQYPYIYLCHTPRSPWAELWPAMQSYQ